jgi:hypothetical protein
MPAKSKECGRIRAIVRSNPSRESSPTILLSPNSAGALNEWRGFLHQRRPVEHHPLSVRFYPRIRWLQFSYSINRALNAFQFCELASASFVWSGDKRGACANPFPDCPRKPQDGYIAQLQNFDISPTSAFGAALLRIIFAGFWIAHWWFKVGYRGMPATEAFFKEQACRRGSHGSISDSSS